MARTEIPKEPVVEALGDVWASTRGLLAGLDEEQWSNQSALPGWDVSDLVAHVIGTESMLSGMDVPPSETDVNELAHVHNPIGAFNEMWIRHLDGTPPAEMLRRFETLTAERLVALEAMDDAAWNAESFTPAGKDTYGRFMRIRVFDCWLHEQDIRDAVDRPGGYDGPAVEQTLDEMSSALGYVVGKLAGAPAGSRVTYVLTGLGGRDVHVEVGARAAVVDELSAPATVTLTMTVGTFVRLSGGRIDAAAAMEHLTIDGDGALGRRLVEHGAYTI